MNLKEFTIDELLIEFPTVTKIGDFSEFKNSHCDLFICALGFESRTLSIPENLSKLALADLFKCENAIYFTYATSTSDNAFNEPRLKSALQSFRNSEGKSISVSNMFCDEDQFLIFFSQTLQTMQASKGGALNILMDISVYSSKLILSVCKVFFEMENINLMLVYTEAETYYPLFSEYNQDKNKFLSESELNTTNGNEDIINSNEYSEGAKENSDLIVAFAPFKVGRINKIICDIDESLLLKNDDRLIWIIGDPNFDDAIERTNRKQMLREINGLSDSSGKSYEVSTLDYKETIRLLESIYQGNMHLHMNIADLGSKMQTIGISVFYHIRPDVSVYYAIPKKYNSNRYSSGVKCHWKIDFTNLKKFIDLIRKVDRFEIEFTKKSDIDFYE